MAPLILASALHTGEWSAACLVLFTPRPEPTE